MIKTEEKRQIVASLIEHMEREELHTGQAAQCLNMNPIYVSMAKSEKSWDSMGKKPWERLAEWFATRANIKDFVIPEGEEIFKKPERAPSARITEPDVPKVKKVKEEPEEYSPANLMPPDFPPDRKMSGKNPSKKAKGVKLNLKADAAGILKGLKDADKQFSLSMELADLRQKVKFLEEQNKSAMMLFAASEASIKACENKYENLLTAIRDHEILIQRLERPELIAKPRKSIVVFQRNIYQK